jgi:Cd2+/Zn2+-exporting ATPase
MDCAEEIAALKRGLVPLVGSEERLVFDLLNARMTVVASDPCVTPDRIIEAVHKAGLDVEPWDDALSRRGPNVAAPFWETHGRAVMCGASLACVCAGFATHAALHGLRAALGLGEPVPFLAAGFYALAAASGGWYVFPKAVMAARRLRPDMNLLMTLAVIGAALIGEWFEAATVAFLFALALLLESWSVGRARRAISVLLDLSPRKARVACPRDGDVEEMPVEDVSVGAIVVVLPGGKIPLDGAVTKGSTSVNQSPITGESAPVPKNVGDEVFAGTINNEGAFEFKVSRPANDTTLASIIRMVEEAQSRKSPTEQWVEKFARCYTPAMMGLALAIGVIPPLILGGWSRWFYEALVILVIACPCALVISTPVSIVAALAAAARAGVLIKGGIHLEAPARLKVIALDKTGTLTYGRPEVQQIAPLNGHTAAEVLARAAGIEALSEHPLARAIVRRAEDDGIAIERAQAYRSMKGKGAQAVWNGLEYWVGSHRFAHEMESETPEMHARAEALEDAGHSVVFLGNARHICGIISIADEVRPNAAEAVRDLHEAGIGRVVMLTGDNEATARAVAAVTGVDECRAELLPEDKLEAVRSLARTYGDVAMVGDGVNDAPAMAAATLGIAMAAAGSDAAIETADIALMSDDLSKLSWLIRHSRRTLRTIQRNISVALSVKALFVVLALAGQATLWMAIAADMGASLLVIFNGLRLLKENKTRSAGSSGCLRSQD